MTGFMIVLLDCNCVEKVGWGAFDQLPFLLLISYLLAFGRIPSQVLLKHSWGIDRGICPTAPVEKY